MTDWFDELYDGQHPDTLSAVATVAPAPTAASPAVPVAGGARLPDWRTGQTVNLDKAAPAVDEADEADDEFGDELADGDELTDDQYDEFDDDGELVEDDETGDLPPRGRVRRVREYVVEHHGDQQRRLRNVVYSGSAAGAGWLLGYESRLHALLDECGRLTGNPYAAVVIGAVAVAAAIAIVDRRTRGWYWPLAWACRIPAATAVLALALYGQHI